MAKFRRQHDRKKGAKMSSLVIKVIFLLAIVMVIAVVLLDIDLSFNSNLSNSDGHQLISGDSYQEIKHKSSFLPYANRGEVVVSDLVSYAYDELTHQPVWVAFQLDRNLIGETYGYKNYIPDSKLLEPSLEVHFFNRTDHLIVPYVFPFFFANQIDAEDKLAVTSLITLQLEDFYNEVWLPFMEKIKEGAVYCDEDIVLVLGPIYPQDDGLGKSRNSSVVAIPEGFYVSFLICKERQCESLNVLLWQNNMHSDRKSQIIPLDSLEQITSIEFYRDLGHDIKPVSLLDEEHNFFSCLTLQ